MGNGDSDIGKELCGGNIVKSGLFDPFIGNIEDVESAKEDLDETEEAACLDIDWFFRGEKVVGLSSGFNLTVMLRLNGPTGVKLGVSSRYDSVASEEDLLVVGV